MPEKDRHRDGLEDPWAMILSCAPLFPTLGENVAEAEKISSHENGKKSQGAARGLKPQSLVLHHQFCGQAQARPFVS